MKNWKSFSLSFTMDSEDTSIIKAGLDTVYATLKTDGNQPGEKRRPRPLKRLDNKRKDGIKWAFLLLGYAVR